MSTQLAPDATAQPKLVPAEKASERWKTLEDRISRLAFDLFLMRDGSNGEAIDDWMHAERSLLEPVRVELLGNDKHLTLSAELPGFAPGDVEVCVEPERMTVSARRADTVEEKDEGLVFTERNWREVFRSIDLPCEVAPDEATTQLSQGVLKVTMPLAKAGVGKN